MTYKRSEQKEKSAKERATEKKNGKRRTQKQQDDVKEKITLQILCPLPRCCQAFVSPSIIHIEPRRWCRFVHKVNQTYRLTRTTSPVHDVCMAQFNSTGISFCLWLGFPSTYVVIVAFFQFQTDFQLRVLQLKIFNLSAHSGLSLFFSCICLFATATADDDDDDVLVLCHSVYTVHT